MAMDVFSYVPDYSAQLSMEPRVIRVSFGDGYESRWSEGLNTNLGKWSLNFKRSPTEAKDIYDFLVARKAVSAFAWEDPDGVTAAFVCDSVSRTIDSIGWHTVSATFRQVPESTA